MSSPIKLGTSQLLFRSAHAKGLTPAWLTARKQVFSVQTRIGEQYVYGIGGLNTQSSSKMAKHKYVTRLILKRGGFSNIPFTRVDSLEGAESFLDTHGTIVVKPLEGAGSVDIHIVHDANQLKDLDLKKYILEKYIRGREERYLVLNGQVIGVHESRYGESVDPNRDLERISYDQSSWNEDLVNGAVEIAASLGLAMAAVDYLIDESGNHFVLEVNSAPGLKWFHAPTTGPSVDVAGLFLDAILQSYSPAVHA